MVLKREDQLASLIPALFVMRLVTVRALFVSPTQIWSSCPITGQNFEGQFCGNEIEVFWLSWQSWRLRCSFGTTFLPSGWRSISFGHQSGISWRDCTSFSATCLLLTPFGLFFIVSLMSLLSFYAHFFLGQTGANLTETACWRAYYATGGSWSRPVSTLTQSKRNSLCPVLMVIGLSASESKFNPPLLVLVVLIDA